MTKAKADIETLKTLRGGCDFLLQKIDSHSKDLTAHLGKMPEKAFVIAAAYTLSGIYSCYEDIFKHIARVFENRIENLASWHSELLNRMMIEVPDIRPAVLSDETIAVLDEMRSFRHVFRNSYVFVIDSNRVEPLTRRWNDARSKIYNEIDTFLKKVGA